MRAESDEKGKCALPPGREVAQILSVANHAAGAARKIFGVNKQ